METAPLGRRDWPFIQLVLFVIGTATMYVRLRLANKDKSMRLKMYRHRKLVWPVKKRPRDH